MSPIELIINRRQDLTDATAIRSAIIAKTIKVVDFEGIQTIGRFTEKYGKVQTSTLLLTVKKAVTAIRSANTDESEATALFIESYANKYIGSGLELDKDNTQAELNELVPVIGQDFVDKIKFLGVRMVSECEQNGIEEPTLETVQDVVKTILAKRRSGNYWSRVLAVINPLLETNKTAEELQTASASVALDIE